ncbi:MAG: type II toxin-antitoxin system HicA family toxin [Bacteroidales bacterium]
MGKLAGFKYREVITILKSLGFAFYRQAAGSHEIWYNEISISTIVHTNRE